MASKPVDSITAKNQPNPAATDSSTKDAPNANNFWASFYALTSFHGLHVLGGVIYLTCMWIGASRGKYNSKNSTPIEIVGLYWHFVDLVWILLFTFVYLIAPGPESKLPMPVAGH